MATKAERFRYEKERSGPKKPKQPPKARRDDAVDTSLPGVSATDRKGTRAPAPRVAKKAAYAFEETAAKPSRKSTRKSANRSRNDAKMRVKRRTTDMRPGARGR